jgi:hypothetical protein
MDNKLPDGRVLRDLIERALEGSAAGTAAEEGAPAGTVIGEVLDTHHPHLPGRVHVRWLGSTAERREGWLQRERHLSLRKGDRVLLTLPTGFREWIVTGALARESAEPVADEHNATQLKLAPGEAIQVLSHDGKPLLTVRQGPAGPVVELGNGNVELKAARTLRLQADTIELQSASGGIDLRTEGDAIVRGRTIRLN